MKVLFLDVDGVLNAWHLPDGESHEGHPIHTQKVGRLQRILDETGAKVVLSSAWRHSHTLEEMDALLTARGWRGELVGSTPDVWVQDASGLWTASMDADIRRGAEIRQWLEDHPEVTSYVILDDTDDMLPEQEERFVRTNPALGLTEADADEAIRILGGAA